jgi:flavorubredoxin
MQCYVLDEDERVLLVGTGLSSQQQQILDQLEALVDSKRISLIPSGFDFTRLCNARPIADRYGVEYVYQPPIFDTPPNWLNFRPDFPLDETDRLRDAQAQSVTTGEPFTFAGRRTLEVLVPPLRLLPNQWLYDEATKTLFTVDVFTWIWREDDTGPWVVTEGDEDTTTAETVRHIVCDNRYWWLPGADTTRIRSALAEVFERYEIENIAPEHGCVLKGSSVVARHYQLLDDLLAAAPSQRAHGVDVGQWSFGGVR